MAHIRRSGDGEGQAVGLVGGPGLGKSRLALEFCRAAQDRATVIVGRCLSYGASIPYLPLFELVRNACGITVGDATDLMRAKIELWVKALELDVSLAHYLRHAFNVTDDDQELIGLDPQAIRNRTFDTLVRLLAAEAARRPLVVLVEDLHWIDQTSQDFLAGLADELPSVPIMLLATYRSGYSPPWTGKSFASQLALRPLSAAASEAIVASVLASTDRAVAAAIAGRGEGNPFFLEELARAARDRATGAADGTVPETVQEVLAARIDRLSADQKAAVQVAAVLGRDFSLDLAEEVWDGTVPLEGLLQELKGLEFLRERLGRVERTFVFKHALTREVAYDGLLQARRRQLHGHAGGALEQSAASQRFEHCELLAYHYSRSAEPARAIPYLVAAGNRARDRYANEEAITVYNQAIRLVEERAVTGGRTPMVPSAKAWAGCWCGSAGMTRPSRPTPRAGLLPATHSRRRTCTCCAVRRRRVPTVTRQHWRTATWLNRHSGQPLKRRTSDGFRPGWMSSMSGWASCTGSTTRRGTAS